MTPPFSGRILRLKLGYNPNSSSIGTIVFGMPAALLGLTVAFGATAALLSAGLVRRTADAGDEPPPAEGDEAPTDDGADDSAAGAP